MKELIFWGGTGQARVLREALDPAEFRLVAIFDNNRSLPSPFADVPIHFGEEGLTAWLKNRHPSGELQACVAIGGTRGRDRLGLQRLLEGRGITPHSVIHRRAFVARDTVIGAGSQILAMAAVCANARLGLSVIVNTAASVDHDCQIGDGAHLAPGVRLAGEVQVGECAFIGTGAVVLPRIRIGHDAVIGAGAVVLHDVAAGATVVGNPAKPLQH